MPEECRTHRPIDNGLFSTTSLWHRPASQNSNESLPLKPRKNRVDPSSDELGLGAGRIFPHSDSSLLHQPQQKHPSEARKRQSTRPRRASCSFGKGDEEIENLIPRRHKPRALLLDHPIKPLDAHRRSGIDDIQREGTDCIRRQRSPSHWRCQRGGILYYIRATVNAVNCDDGI